jgi:hypothetical protein
MTKTSAKGRTGGILGIATSVAGFAWIATLIIFMSDLMNYANIVNFTAGIPIPVLGQSAYNGIVVSLIVPYPSSFNLPVFMSIIFVGLLIVFGAIIGLGFQSYGESQFSAFGATVIQKRGAERSLYLACSLVGTLISGILILIGEVSQTTIIYNFLRVYGSTIFTPIRIPELLYTWLGLAVLGVVLIILGVASIRIRSLVKWRDTATAAGTLSIVCGAVFNLLVVVVIIYSTQLASFWNPLLMALIFPMPAGMTNAVLSGFEFSTILSLAGFGLLFIVSILWTRVFLAPR